MQNETAIRTLLDCGVDSGARDSSCPTPTSWVVPKGLGGYCANTRERQNVGVSSRNALDRAALCYVARVRYEDTVKGLLSDRGMGVNFRDGGYKTPLRPAIYQGIRLLCDFCCRIKCGGQSLGATRVNGASSGGLSTRWSDSAAATEAGRYRPCQGGDTLVEALA